MSVISDIFKGETNIDISDEEVVASLLVAEAGSQKKIGMQAVMNVIQNRSKSGRKRFATSIREVAMSDEFEPMIEVNKGNKSLSSFVEEMKGLKEYKTAQGLVKKAMGGELEDVTSGATHYVNPTIVEERREAADKGKTLPKWADWEKGFNPKFHKKLKIGEKYLDIGEHRFGWSY